MPDTDQVVPLCSVAAFTESGFADLVRNFGPGAQNDMLIEATRKMEGLAGRRLAPFTITETRQAYGINPDEYASTTSLPVSIQSTLGMSYASSLGMTNLVRHAWLSEYPPRYQDMWAAANMSVTVIRTYGGTAGVSAAQILDGPDDTGHVWFQLGQFIPVASRLRVTYSGGYAPAVPGDLVRSCRYFAAGIAVTELNPGSTAHNPDRLFALGEKWLAGYLRDPVAAAR